MRRLNESISAIINGLRVRKSSVFVPNSKFTKSVLMVLSKEGYLGQVAETDDNKLSVELKYYKRLPVMKKVKFISHGGFLMYTKKIKAIPRNFNVLILSTSKGVMTHMDAVNLGIGGKLLLEVF